MTNENKKRFRYIYKIVLSASIIVAGLCLIAGCAYIYFSGNDFSRKIVANIFSKINIPIYLSLALIVGDIIWELISPSTTKNKTTNKKASSSVESEEKADKKLCIAKLIVLAVAVALFVFGFFAGGYVDVLTKAVNLCTECVGLG